MSYVATNKIMKMSISLKRDLKGTGVKEDLNKKLQTADRKSVV